MSMRKAMQETEAEEESHGDRRTRIMACNRPPHPPSTSPMRSFPSNDSVAEEEGETKGTRHEGTREAEYRQPLSRTSLISGETLSSWSWSTHSQTPMKPTTVETMISTLRRVPDYRAAVAAPPLIAMRRARFDGLLLPHSAPSVP